MGDENDARTVGRNSTSENSTSDQRPSWRRPVATILKVEETETGTNSTTDGSASFS
jgi:hypothetical protein